MIEQNFKLQILSRVLRMTWHTLFKLKCRVQSLSPQKKLFTETKINVTKHYKLKILQRLTSLITYHPKWIRLKLKCKQFIKESSTMILMLKKCLKQELNLIFTSQRFTSHNSWPSSILLSRIDMLTCKQKQTSTSISLLCFRKLTQNLISSSEWISSKRERPTKFSKCLRTGNDSARRSRQACTSDRTFKFNEIKPRNPNFLTRNQYR